MQYLVKSKDKKSLSKCKLVTYQQSSGQEVILVYCLYSKDDISTDDACPYPQTSVHIKAGALKITHQQSLVIIISLHWPGGHISLQPLYTEFSKKWYRGLRFMLPPRKTQRLF